MARPGRIQPHYTTASAVMRQRMRTMLGLYTLHKTTFEGFSPEFDTDFAADWLAAIEAAESEEQGAARTAQLQEDTAEVELHMAQARTELQTLFYFVGRTYPGNAARLDEYGRRKYEAARNSHELMDALLEQALKAATRDHLALAAKGYTAARLDALDTLEEELTEANTDQEIKKGTNLEATDHYITAQNLAYSFGQQVSEASKILFMANATLLDIFRLGPGEGPATETHEVTLAPGEDKWVLFDTPLVAPVQLRLRAVEPAPGLQLLLGRTLLTDQRPPLTVALSHDTPDLTVAAADLGAGPYVAVRNDGPAPSRVQLQVVA